MSNRVYPEICNTCGIELESDKVIAPQENFPLRSDWKVTHDASIYTDKRFSNGFILEEESDQRIQILLSTRSIRCGMEIASNILLIDEAFPAIAQALGFLGEYGTPSGRAGIHFHISVPNPTLKMLQNFLQFGRYTEPLFYTLAGMGGIFRGIENDSTYCRPITKFGPQCIRRSSNGNAWYQCYNIEDALQAKRMSEFWEIFGDCFNHNGRYNPIRYSWLNLYPMFRDGRDYKGTLEFRVFNATLNPIFVYTTLKICQAFTKFCIKESLSSNELMGVRENSIFDGYTKSDIFDLYSNFGYMTNLDKEYFERGRKILELSDIPRLKGEYIKTHLRIEPNYFRGTNYVPQKVNKEPKKPHYIDIHVLNGEV